MRGHWSLSMDRDPTTETITGAAVEVSNSLGAGFLEKVYRRALAEELRLRGVLVEEEVRYRVVYKGKSVGEYVADWFVSGLVVVELKCSAGIANESVAQVLNYLKASGLQVGLILNFERRRVEWRRVVRGYEFEPQMDADSRG